MFGQSHPAATITITATRGNKKRRRIPSWSFPDQPRVKKSPFPRCARPGRNGRAATAGKVSDGVLWEDGRS
jgi:hypothetical protein